MLSLLRGLDQQVRVAVKHFWATRQRQTRSQQTRGKRDQGARGAVTGGAQMDGFIDILAGLAVKVGADPSWVHRKKALELPGFFRPTKEWDLLVVKDGQLVCALEAKSQVGPSFGNNFNNRTEEAIGSALDLWTAYRKGALNKAAPPWLGYIFLLEDCPGSQHPVRVKEPHFKVLPEFREASYAGRYELLCRKLMRERHYNATAFLMSKRPARPSGRYSEPAEDLAMTNFCRAFVSHIAAYGRD